MMGVDAKICGLTRREDALLAVEAGARYLGVILAPGGARSLRPAEAASVLDGAGARKVGVFVDADAGEIRDAIATAGLDVAQLHGDEPPELGRILREDAAVQVWKAVRVRTPGDVLDAAERYADSVDGMLLDGWSGRARGGTGTSFPWEQVARIRSDLPAGMTLVVAGGLRPDTVSRAAALLRPDVVDVSSGVESAPGRKDADLVRRFLTAAQSSGADTEPHDDS